jgi:UDP-2,3-diacylglucosamine pyrophosphatase LpxH
MGVAQEAQGVAETIKKMYLSYTIKKARVYYIKKTRDKLILQRFESETLSMPLITTNFYKFKIEQG